MPRADGLRRPYRPGSRVLIPTGTLRLPPLLPGSSHLLSRLQLLHARVALHGLNRRLSGVNVMTYDQLLAQRERLIEMLCARAESDSESVPDLETWELGEDAPAF